jgi:hypothetical protein
MGILPEAPRPTFRSRSGNADFLPLVPRPTPPTWLPCAAPT